MGECRECAQPYRGESGVEVGRGACGGVQRMCAALKRGFRCRGRSRYLWGSAGNVRSLKGKEL